MEYILINGQNLPTPSFGSGGQEHVNYTDSARNANGVFIGQKVGRTQVKLNLTWKYLTATQWEFILSEIDKNPFGISVNYYDAVKNARITRTMYVGNRNGTPYRVDLDGKPTAYVDCQCNLIDTGAGN